MTTIKEIFKDRKGRPKGVIIAVSDGDEVRIGHSMCDFRHDNFDKHLGTKIAYNRAIKGSKKEIPKTVKKVMPRFYGRCERYFKDKKLKQPVFIE